MLSSRHLHNTDFTAPRSQSSGETTVRTPRAGTTVGSRLNSLDFKSVVIGDADENVAPFLEIAGQRDSFGNMGEDSFSFANVERQFDKGPSESRLLNAALYLQCFRDRAHVNIMRA